MVFSGDVAVLETLLQEESRLENRLILGVVYVCACRVSKRSH
jgi:hypothetical protein